MCLNPKGCTLSPCHPVTNTAIDHHVIENTRTAVAHASNCIHKTLQCTQSELQSRSTTHTSLSRSPALQDRLPVYSNFFIECRFPAASSRHKPKSQHTYTTMTSPITPLTHPTPRQLFSSHTRNYSLQDRCPVYSNLVHSCKPVAGLLVSRHPADAGSQLYNTGFRF